MATQTQQIISFAGGLCVWTFDWDDVGLTILALDCNNTNGLHPSRGTLTVNANGRTFTRRVTAGNTLHVNAPQTAQTRLDITLDTSHDPPRVNGIDWHFEYGAGV